MRKKSFPAVVIAGCAVILFCLAGSVAGGPGPNPNVPVGYKQVGPGVKGFLIGGWIESSGSIELFLVLEDKLYNVVLATDSPEGLDCIPPSTGFLCTTAADITTYQLPSDIADDFGMDDLTIARILEEKDVENFMLNPYIEPSEGLGVGQNVAYKHMFHCQVRITFLEPVKK